MIMFDIKEGATELVTGKCFISPKTKLTKESLTSKSSIEITCEETCKEKKPPCEAFDVGAEITYEPFF